MECPNVRYARGEDVLLIAQKMPNGHYETLYAGAGKFIIKDETINKEPFIKGISYNSARAEINQQILKLKIKGI